MTTRPAPHRAFHHPDAHFPENLNARLEHIFLVNILVKKRTADHERESRQRHGVGRADELMGRHLEAFTHYIPSEDWNRPTLSDPLIDRWINDLATDAKNAGNPEPSASVLEETKRVAIGLRHYLPPDTDVYTLEDGKVAVEVFGSTGRAFLLVLEPGGTALCLVTTPGTSRRARYDNSAILPDGFTREGLQAVRFAT